MGRATLTSVEGVYKDGKVQLLDEPVGIDEARVIVTFLPSGSTAGGEVELRVRGIDESQAADLRGRLRAFAQDWDREDMQAYDAL